MVNPHAYTNGIYKCRVLLVGQVPPPYGGVSVHVERTKHKLEAQGNKVVLFDPCLMYASAWMSARWIKYLFGSWYMVRFFAAIVSACPDVVIYHISYNRQLLPELFLIVILKFLFKFRVILVDHDCRHMALRSERWIAWYTRLLRSCDQCVVIGSLTAHSYLARDIHDVPLSVESAFLPPDLSHYQRLVSQYPCSLIDFLHAHSPIVIMNGFQWVLCNGQDLYGFDLAVESLHGLMQDHPAIGLVILISTMGDAEYRGRIMHTIKEYNLESHVYVIQGTYQLWPLFRHADLFIRPTRSDGASVSIEEALFCKIPVIATNVCWRPDGVITCVPTSDALCPAISAVLSDKKGDINDTVRRYNLYPESP